MTFRLLDRSLLVAVCVAGFAASVQAQSLDPRKPAPLGAGVNKGNIDSLEGSHYYYFFAEPGHVDVEMAFQERGVFGAPLRQSLTFDFYNDMGQVISHNVVVSLDKLERIHADGDFAKRERLVLAVVPQSAAVRLGGYYEIHVTGSAAFEGKAADVAPAPSPRLVNPPR
jgi:hypothetical protein